MIVEFIHFTFQTQNDYFNLIAPHFFLQEVNNLCSHPRVVDITKRKPGMFFFILCKILNVYIEF